MTSNPECASFETTILDALHMMHDGKFLHLPVVDRGELCFVNVVGCFLCWRFSLSFVLQMDMLPLV